LREKGGFLEALRGGSPEKAAEQIGKPHTQDIAEFENLRNRDLTL